MIINLFKTQSGSSAKETKECEIDMREGDIIFSLSQKANSNEKNN